VSGVIYCLSLDELWIVNQVAVAIQFSVTTGIDAAVAAIVKSVEIHSGFTVRPVLYRVSSVAIPLCLAPVDQCDIERSPFGECQWLIEL
jgi:hypothetical protein